MFVKTNGVNVDAMILIDNITIVSICVNANSLQHSLVVPNIPTKNCKKTINVKNVVCKIGRKNVKTSLLLVKYIKKHLHATL